MSWGSFILKVQLDVLLLMVATLTVEWEYVLCKTGKCIYYTCFVVILGRFYTQKYKINGKSSNKISVVLQVWKGWLKDVEDRKRHKIGSRQNDFVPEGCFLWLSIQIRGLFGAACVEFSFLRLWWRRWDVCTWHFRRLPARVSSLYLHLLLPMVLFHLLSSVHCCLWPLCVPIILSSHAGVIRLMQAADNEMQKNRVVDYWREKWQWKRKQCGRVWKERRESGETLRGFWWVFFVFW